MKKNIDLSIVIPCYQGEQFIQRCLDSVLKIKQIEYEVIIINDGSTDGSSEMLEQYSMLNENMRIIHQLNQGVSNALNNGIQNAEGTYIFVLAIDDWCIPSTVLNTVILAKEHETDILGFKLAYFDESFNQTGIKSNHTSELDTVYRGEVLLQGSYTPSSICPFIFSRDLFVSNGIWFVEGITQNDVEISIRLMLKAQRVMFVQDIGYCYYRHSNSITTSKSYLRRKQYIKDSVKLIQEITKTLNSYSMSDTTNRSVNISKNSVVWNLILRLIVENEVYLIDKKEILNSLTKLGVYPVTGPLATRFQRISSLFMNQKWLLLMLLKCLTIIRPYKLQN
ncbi:glycosyltransferase [Bacteroidia bacterium]|nr:glycosyltransferase [Bacteroidia bacterium]